LGQPQDELRILMDKLTKPRIAELQKLEHECQSTFGSSRARVQHWLVSNKLARFINRNGVEVSPDDADWCEITDEGQKALREHISKTIKKLRGIRGEKGRSLEERFSQVQEKAIVKAERIKCPMRDFLEGLKTMRIALNERISQVMMEINADDD
jgi:hypothetical protein